MASNTFVNQCDVHHHMSILAPWTGSYKGAIIREVWVGIHLGIPRVVALAITSRVIVFMPFKRLGDSITLGIHKWKDYKGEGRVHSIREGVVDPQG